MQQHISHKFVFELIANRYIKIKKSTIDIQKKLSATCIPICISHTHKTISAPDHISADISVAHAHHTYSEIHQMKLASADFLLAVLAFVAALDGDGEDGVGA